MSQGRKVKISVILLCLIAFSFINFSCAAKEAEQPKTYIPSQKIDVKEMSLEEISEESKLALSTTWTPYTVDEFLSYLSTKKKKPEVKKEEGGPVTVTLVYPSRYSLIDRSVDFVAHAFSSSGKVDKVEFYIDGLRVAELSSPPYVFNFNPEAYSKSEHTIKVVARSGRYSDSDSIKFYNVIKGSIVIYPWKTNGGNIPYSYLNNYYMPDGTVIEAALFTAYYNSYFYVDYIRKLPPGFNYLLGSVNFNGVIVADRNPEKLYVRFFNYALKGFDPSYLYDWESMQTPAQGPDKPGEAFTFSPYDKTVEYVGKLTGSILPFYAFNPYTKEIRLRIEGSGPAKFYVTPIEVEYYAIEDREAPKLRYRTVYATGTSVKCEFYVSEPVFATIYAYDRDGSVRSFSEPKLEGWVEIEIADRNTAFVSIKAVDGAGNTSRLPKAKVQR